MAWTLLLSAHVAAAAVAIPLGAFNLLRKPRGDGLHRAVGYTWVALMVWVAVSSFWIRELNDGAFSWIHGLSVLILVTMALGVHHGIRGNLKAHRGNMLGSFLGLVGAFIGAIAVPDRAVPQLATRDPVAFALMVAGVLAAAAIVVLVTRFAVRHRVRAPRA